MTKHKRTMALDVGTVTVGVAVSDPFGWFAQPLETIKINEASGELGLSRVQELIGEYNVERVVIGLPKNMDNTLGPRSEASLAYGEALGELVPEVDIIYQDERLTTVQAERFLIEEYDSSRKKRKEVIDQVAAEIILQNYLDRIQ